MIDDLKGRVLELSDADVNLLADPQQPCTLRDHRVADELITALAREVQAFRAAVGCPRAVYAMDEAARTVTLRRPGSQCAEEYKFDALTPALVSRLRRASAAMPSGYSAALVRAYEELIRRGLIAGEGAAGG